MNPGLGPWTARIKLIALVALLMLAAGCDRLPPRQATATPLPVPTPVQTPDSSLPPEILAARDAGLEALRAITPGLAPPAETAWLGRDTTPAGVVDVTSYEFASSGWAVSVASLSLSPSVVAYELSLDHAQSGLHWAGRLNQSLDLVESNINVSAEALVARQIALDYLAGHDAAHAPPTNLVWFGSRTTTTGLPGRESYQFSAGGWEMLVDYDLGSPNDVVYEIVLFGPGNGFLWRGQVDAQGTVLEHR